MKWRDIDENWTRRHEFRKDNCFHGAPGFYSFMIEDLVHYMDILRLIVKNLNKMATCL